MGVNTIDEVKIVRGKYRMSERVDELIYSTNSRINLKNDSEFEKVLLICYNRFRSTVQQK